MSDEDEGVGIGHNSRKAKPEAVNADQLRKLIQRIERLEEEKKSLSEDIKEVYAEAKASGYDTKILRKAVQLRKLSKPDLEYLQEMTDLYLGVFG